MFSSIIISGALAQDHEFIYPFYRLKEEGLEVDVYNQSDQIVNGFFGTKIPPQKNDNIIALKDVNVDEYDLLVLPGGVKSMEL